MIEWMWTAAWAWIGWTIVGPLIAGAFLLFVMALCSIPSWVRTARCKHERVTETRSCDALCLDCGANLGFIGTWRERTTKNNLERRP